MQNLTQYNQITKQSFHLKIESESLNNLSFNYNIIYLYLFLNVTINFIYITILRFYYNTSMFFEIFCRISKISSYSL